MLLKKKSNIGKDYRWIDRRSEKNLDFYGSSCELKKYTVRQIETGKKFLHVGELNTVSQLFPAITKKLFGGINVCFH